MEAWNLTKGRRKKIKGSRMLSIQSCRIFKYNFCPLVYLIINDLRIFSLNLDDLGEVWSLVYT